MNGQLRCSRRAEAVLTRLLTTPGIFVGEEPARARGHALRLAVAISMRRPVDPELVAWDSPSGVVYNGGATPRQWVTGGPGGGDGEPDLSDALRAMLSVQHELDLLGEDNDDELFEALLERHIHRGLMALMRAWPLDEGPHHALAGLLAPLDAEEAEGVDR